MTTLGESDVLAGSVRRVVGRMSVIRGHGMPESFECRADTVEEGVSTSSSRINVIIAYPPLPAMMED